MTIPGEVHDEHRRRLANQRLFRRYYVNCLCEGGCYICAFTGLVTKGHARHTSPTSGKITGAHAGHLQGQQRGQRPMS